PIGTRLLRVTHPLKVALLENVFEPVKVCAPVLTNPGYVSSAVCIYSVEPSIAAPLADLVVPSRAPIDIEPPAPDPERIVTTPAESLVLSTPPSLYRNTPFVIEVDGGVTASKIAIAP